MENKQKKEQKIHSDEVDLGQFIELLRRGYAGLSRAFLRTFIYLKRKAIIIALIVVIGFAIGYFLNNIKETSYKIEVIVKPQLESKEYLYDAIDEIQSNLWAQDLEFFQEMGIDLETTEGYFVEIEKLENDSEGLQEGMEYLELLLSTDNASLISDIARAEILNRSSFAHRITFIYSDNRQGPEFAKKVLEYINSNDYFETLTEVNRENAEQRVAENMRTLAQIDEILKNYSQNMETTTPSDGRIVLNTEEGLDIPGILSWRSRLLQEVEEKNIELSGQGKAVTILNFGKQQLLIKPLYVNLKVLVPGVLLVMFFLWEWFRYLDRRARETQIT